MNEFMTVAANRDYSKEWQAPGSFPWIFQRSKPAIEARPISVKDNYARCVKGEKPYWMPAYFYEADIVWPDAMEEHPVPEVDGYDWWGVYWQMVDSAGGMITKPGTRVIKDFANWQNEVPWPDLSVVDFETDGQKIQKMLDPERAHIYECVEGLFERLHEMMPFDETLMAFYEEPEQLEAFFQKMVDYKIESCSKVFKYYGRVDGVLYHDDWGTQRAGFFSNDMFREQIMPATKRLFDYIKGQGKFIELHSCGKNIQYVPMMIEMGIDMWTPQLFINEPDYLYEIYGTQMTFTIPLMLAPGWSEGEIRKAVRGFVDRYGKTGRIMCWIMTDSNDQKAEAIARDELYHYSLDVYNSLFGR
ncbi:MAG: uroporphyrinogen decarboxylase family protein [Eubacteriaceae bacterium]